MPSKLAAQIAERCRRKVVLGTGPSFEEIIDDELADVFSVLAIANRWVPEETIHAVPVTGSDKPGDYESVPHPAKARVRAALASLEVRK